MELIDQFEVEAKCDVGQILNSHAHQDFLPVTDLNKHTSWRIFLYSNHKKLGVFDTLSDLIQCLNSAKKWSIQYLIQYCFTQDSIQNIIQFKENSADSIQKIIQFNSQGIIDTGRIGKVPNDCPKSVQIRQKGGFSSKMANIDQSRCQLLKI